MAVDFSRAELRIKWRTLFVLGVVLMLGVAAGSYLGRSTSVDAAGTGKELCVTDTGKVVKRDDCRRGESQVASGRYRTKALPARTARRGTNVMPAGGLRTGEFGSPGDKADEVGIALEATEMFANDTTAVTVRYSVPAGWQGSVLGACPDYAPTLITWGFYSPEWASILAAHPEIQMYAPIYYGGGPQLNVRRQGGDTAAIRNLFEQKGIAKDPADPFTLYVTQVCAPIVGLQAIG